MKTKKRIGLIFGGKSSEHEVSIISAKNIFDALDKEKYEVVIIGIDREGKWILGDSTLLLNSSLDPKLLKSSSNVSDAIMTTGGKRGEIVSYGKTQNISTLDVVFPVLHGPYGEDGTMQGLLKLAGIPFVGAGVLGSAVGMDKDVMKRLLRDAKIPIAKFLVFKKKEELKFDKIKKELGLPFFVKPANLGSSVGISKVHDEKEFDSAVSQAFQFDNKILIEESIDGREIECAVLGNDDPIASIPGEVIPTHEFYSYDAKYIDEKGAQLAIPAKLDKKTEEKIRKLAVKTFKVLACEGMARIDFFLQKNKVFVNEINTIPGFTKISMYPKLWEATGIQYSKLIDNLIDLAIERFEKEKNLKTTVT